MATLTDVETRTVVAAANEIDLASSPDLRTAVAAAFECGAQEVCVDLTDTTFMDSSGLHVLSDAHRIAEQERRRLTIVCPLGNVRRVFELTGLDKSLRLYEDLDAALTYDSDSSTKISKARVG
jgi:anti-sigma B factor antagonist